MRKLKQLTRAEAFTNARVKFFVDKYGEPHFFELMAFPETTFNALGVEASEKTWKAPLFRQKIDETLTEIGRTPMLEPLDEGAAADLAARENRRKAFSRAKRRLFDLLMANYQLDVFVTLTFDKNVIDRYNYNEIMMALNRWLSNRVQRNGCEYILVPEPHKDGAIHFHGLFNKSSLSLVDSGKKLNRKIVYNIDDFPYGFSWVQNITGGADGRIAAGKYIYKYVVKTGGAKVGGRYYLHGGKLKEPQYLYLNVDYNNLKAHEYRPSECVRLKILNLEGVTMEYLTLLGVLNEN